MERITLTMTVEVTSDTNIQALAESLFDFLASDPEDLFPSIETVIDYGFHHQD